jgi:hypothetical protein
MKKLNLGILYKDNKIVNHRSLIKVILNPILRYFGYHIATVVNDNRDTIIGVVIRKCDKVNMIKYTLEHNECDYIIKKRIII